MQLAANDFARGVVTPAQLDNIRASARSLVEDFEDHDDAEPAVKASDINPSDTPTLAERNASEDGCGARAGATARKPPGGVEGRGAVLCLAGRGPLDEASSAMLAQLLLKHGLGTRVTSYQSASREGIRELDFSGVAMVCVSYLDITKTRHTCATCWKRLKRRAPAYRSRSGCGRSARRSSPTRRSAVRSARTP